MVSDIPAGDGKTDNFFTVYRPPLILYLSFFPNFPVSNAVSSHSVIKISLMNNTKYLIYETIKSVIHLVSNAVDSSFSIRQLKPNYQYMALWMCLYMMKAGGGGRKVGVEV